MTGGGLPRRSAHQRPHLSRRNTAYRAAALRWGIERPEGLGTGGRLVASRVSKGRSTCECCCCYVDDGERLGVVEFDEGRVVWTCLDCLGES